MNPNKPKHRRPKKDLSWRRQTNAEKKAELKAGHKYLHISVPLGYVPGTGYVAAPPHDRRNYVRPHK